jgi:hypothetical protein
MCGTLFDPGEHAACQSCPLVKGCNLVCCPVCGYETVDPERSRLVQALRMLLNTRKNQSAAIKVLERKIS